MNKTEIIILDGVEYTAELNRDSAITIEKYAHLTEKHKLIEENKQKLSLKYINDEDINDEENPFANVEENEAILEAKINSENLIKDLYAKSFWIWIYPHHKLSLKKVREIIEKIITNEEEFTKIAKLHSDLMIKSVEIQKQDVEKKKIAQANK